MKLSRLLLVFILAFATVFTSCTRYVVIHKHKPLPPGHAKKIYGSKSAKHHAPGHKKGHKKHAHR